ncbi:MAG TPA: hypothetical protein VEK38_02130 [Candidatus Bathyarchaeia archaeon]|nr:hypothetical protein [Candidatus Bathyarchaeia archaeon]
MNQKHTYLFITICITSLALLHGRNWIENRPKAIFGHNFTVEIMNKSSENIWVDVEVQNDLIVQHYGINGMVGNKRGFMRIADVDTANPITISLYMHYPKEEKYATPSATYTINPQGRTVFLTWDGKTLRPQTGPLLGLLNKTESGLPLKNNVTAGNIQQIWSSRGVEEFR